MRYTQFIVCVEESLNKFCCSKEKTLLFIVIRDHVGSTPLANLARTLQADLEKIWAGLAKVIL